MSDEGSGHETVINSVTLVGSVFGQIILGFMADRYGRRKLYGWELVLLMLGSLGVAFAAEGYNKSMNIRSLLIFWRLVVGIGIGAEYPTTAVIASE